MNEQADEAPIPSLIGALGQVILERSTMLSATDRPRLVRQARLGADQQTGRYLLLLPEGALEINASGAEIVQLCNGERSVLEIVEELCRQHKSESFERLDQDARRFLEMLDERGILELVD